MLSYILRGGAVVAQLAHNQRVTSSILVLASILAGCGSSVTVGDDNGDNRNNQQTFFEPNESSNPTTPKDGSNPDCSADPFGVDGAGGFLWKPVSDSRSSLVVLFPDSYDVQFERVVATRLDGTQEEGAFSGFANGNRQHWRFVEAGENYNGALQIFDEAQECSAFVANPAERQD